MRALESQRGIFMGKFFSQLVIANGNRQGFALARVWGLEWDRRHGATASVEVGTGSGGRRG